MEERRREALRQWRLIFGFYSGNLVAGSPPCKFSAGWERLRLTGGVALWRRRAMLALGRLRFGLQRRLRGRASTGPAHRKAERAQARAGQDIIWQIRADGSEFPQAAPRVLRAVPGQLFRRGAWRCARQWSGVFFIFFSFSFFLLGCAF